LAGGGVADIAALAFTACRAAPIVAALFTLTKGYARSVTTDPLGGAVLSHGADAALAAASIVATFERVVVVVRAGGGTAFRGGKADLAHCALGALPFSETPAAIVKLLCTLRLTCVAGLAALIPFARFDDGIAHTSGACLAFVADAACSTAPVVTTI